MDIRSFGAANVMKFYELGFLKDVPGIYQLLSIKLLNWKALEKKALTISSLPSKNLKNNRCTGSFMPWASGMLGKPLQRPWPKR